MKKILIILIPFFFLSCNKEKHCECFVTEGIKTNTFVEEKTIGPDFRTYNGRKNKSICDSYETEYRKFYPMQDTIKGFYSDTTSYLKVVCSGDGR